MTEPDYTREPAVRAFIRIAQDAAETFEIHEVSPGRWLARMGNHSAKEHMHWMAVGETPTEAADAVASMYIFAMRCAYCRRDCASDLMWTDLTPFDWCVWARKGDNGSRWIPSCEPGMASYVERHQKEDS